MRKGAQMSLLTRQKNLSLITHCDCASSTWATKFNFAQPTQFFCRHLVSFSAKWELHTLVLASVGGQAQIIQLKAVFTRYFLYSRKLSLFACFLFHLQWAAAFRNYLRTGTFALSQSMNSATSIVLQILLFFSPLSECFLLSKPVAHVQSLRKLFRKKCPQKFDQKSLIKNDRH